MTEAPKPGPADARGPSSRAILGWGAAMLCVLAAAWFGGRAAFSVWRTRSAVEACSAEPTGKYGPPGWYRKAPEEIEKLGGAEPAARRLAFYLRLPKRLAPNRTVALGMLGRCGACAGPYLAEHLDDPDSDTRDMVIRCLGEAGAVRELTAALDSQHRDVRSGACWALGRFDAEGAGGAVPALLDRLDDADESVARKAVDALAGLGSPEVLASAVRDAKRSRDARRRAATALALAGGPGVAKLRELLADPDPALRETAASLEGPAFLWRTAPPPELSEALFPALDDREPRVALAAFRTLAVIGASDDPRCLAAAEKHLGGPDPEARALAVAVAAMGQTDPERRAALAIKGVGDREEPVRCAAVLALGAMAEQGFRTAGAREVLTAALKSDPSAAVRGQAAQALAATGGPEAARALEQALQDREESVREAVRRAIARLKEASGAAAGAGQAAGN